VNGLVGTLKQMPSSCRVLLLADDVETAIDVIVALEEDGHRVEHVFHLEDAMLRARVARYDALVVASAHCDKALARTWPVRHPSVPLLLVDPSPEARVSAQISGSACLSTPIDATVVAAVLAERLEAARRVMPPPPISGIRLRTPRVLLVLRRTLASGVDRREIERELEAECLLAPDVRTADALLDGRLDAVVMDGELMVDPGAGVALRQRIHARGLTLVPLRIDHARGSAGLSTALREVAAEVRGAVKRALG
jgi:hypothetical protein